MLGIEVEVNPRMGSLTGSDEDEMEYSSDEGNTLLTSNPWSVLSRKNNE